MFPIKGHLGRGDTAGSRPRPLHRSLAWLLIGAVAMPAAILAAGGWRSWEAVWRESRIELARQADASAEYAMRLLLITALPPAG